MKRIISLILCLMFVFSTMCFRVSAQPGYTFETERGNGDGLVPIKELIFSENFDSAVSLENGSIWGTGGKTLTLENNLTASVSDKNLKINGKGSSTNTLKLKSEIPIKGKYTTEFKFKILGQAATKTLFSVNYIDSYGERTAIEIDTDKFTSDDTRFYRNFNYKKSDGNKSPLVDLTSSWRTLMDYHKWFLIHGDDPNWAKYSTDWFVMKAVIDTDTERYSLYLNGSLCVKDEPFVDASSYDFASSGINIPFAVAEECAGLKFDDIKIYREPVGTETIYANDFNSYPEVREWKGSANYNPQRGSLFAGVAGLGLATLQNKGGSIKAQNNALVTEYRNGMGGAFPGMIRMDSDMTIDMDFTVDSFTEDSYLDNYATVLVITSTGADGIRFSVSKDGKFIYYYYNLTIPYEPTILTNIEMDKPHHLTLYMDFEEAVCDLYIDGVLIAENRSLLRQPAKKGVSGYMKNGEDIVLGLGYHKESPTTDVTYDNIRIYRDEREEVFSEIATDLKSRFNTTANVKGDVELFTRPSFTPKYSVKWKSNSDVIAIKNDGYSATVTPKSEESNVILTATVTDSNNEFSLSRSYNVTVNKDDSISDLSSLTDWMVVNGEPLLSENPTNEVDKTVNITPLSDVYNIVKKTEGKAQVNIPVYTEENSVGTIYLMDENKKKFAVISLDKGSIFEGKTLVESDAYPSKKWVTLTLVTDMLKRCYDVYLDNKKINNAPISFDNNIPSDKANLSYVGFTSSEGNFYINDVTVDALAFEEGVNVSGIIYENEKGESANAPSKNAKITAVEVINTLTSQNASIVVAVYDGNGRMIDVGKTPSLLLDKGISRVDVSNVGIGPDWNQNYTVKAFIWKEQITPLTNTHGENLSPAIYIVGDSLVSDYGAECYPYTGWGSAFADAFDGEKIRVLNMARENATVSDFIERGYLDTVKKNLKEGDYLFAAFGADDALNNTEENTFKEKINSVIEAAKENGAEAVLVTVPSLTATDVTAYNGYIKDIAELSGIRVLDLASSWNAFLEKSENDDAFYADEIDSYQKSSAQWNLSKLNPESPSYDETLAGKAARLSPQGARLAASVLSELVKNSDLSLSAVLKSEPLFTYSVKDGELTVEGSGKMPIFAGFAETPWKDANITTIRVADGITTISADAFSGFGNVKAIYLPESITEISNGAFPENNNFTLYSVNNSVAKRLSENDENIDFAFEKFRILGIGNSHTHDYMNWRDLVFNDLKNAGLKTQIEFDYIVVGGAQLYYKDIGYVGVAGEYRSHYTQGSNPNRAYYNTYQLLREKQYDLVLVQDYRESVMDSYRYSFAPDFKKVVRWIKNEQPTADVAWVSDWTDMNSTGARGKLLSQWQTNSVAVMQGMTALDADAPDFVVPMSTALQNARSSYLGSVYNAADCYGDNSNTDWNGTNGITNFTILERDGTHCSYELGRYLVSAAVFGKVFDVYKDAMDGMDFDFFDVLKTTPEYVTNSIYPWNGEMTDNHLAIVRESARNAISTPFAVTQSVYTVDPADAVCENVAALNYTAFTADGIAATINGAALGVTVSASDVILGSDGLTATVTLLHGYTKKTVTLAK